MGIDGFGMTESELGSWKAFIGQQYEIQFTGMDGTKQRAAGIFKGLDNSNVYPKDPTKRVVILQPSGLTTDPQNPVKIYAGDLTRVYISNVDWFRQSSYNLSTWPFIGSGTPATQIKLPALPPADNQNSLLANLGMLGSLQKILTNPWYIGGMVATAVLGVWLVTRDGGKGKPQYVAIGRTAPQPQPVQSKKKARR